MRAFIIACSVAIILAVGAAAMLRLRRSPRLPYASMSRSGCIIHRPSGSFEVMQRCANAFADAGADAALQKHRR